jgi:hypothetical protein
MTRLEDFAAEEPGHSRCYTCNLPPEVLAQVEDARRKRTKTPFKIIAKWLAAEGYPVKHPTLINHFRFGHADHGAAK